MKAERQSVYDALDKVDDIVFCALCFAMFGVLRVLGLTVVDDPSPLVEVEQAIKPHMDRLG